MVAQDFSFVLDDQKATRAAEQASKYVILNNIRGALRPFHDVGRPGSGAGYIAAIFAGPCIGKTKAMIQVLREASLRGEFDILTSPLNNVRNTQVVLLQKFMGDELFE